MDHAIKTNSTKTTESTTRDFNQPDNNPESTPKLKIPASQSLHLIRRRRLRTVQRIAAATVSCAITRVIYIT